MILILISYDLNRPGQNYQTLIETIKSLGYCYHCLDSTWLVKTSLTPEMVTSRLTRRIDDNDSLLVIPVNPWAIKGFLPKKTWNWIES